MTTLRSNLVRDLANQIAERLTVGTTWHASCEVASPVHRAITAARASKCETKSIQGSSVWCTTRSRQRESPGTVQPGAAPRPGGPHHQRKQRKPEAGQRERAWVQRWLTGAPRKYLLTCIILSLQSWCPSKAPAPSKRDSRRRVSHCPALPPVQGIPSARCMACEAGLYFCQRRPRPTTDRLTVYAYSK